MTTIRTHARTAGLLYLAVAVTGGFSLLYLPSLIAAGDPATTAANVRANEPFFRLAVLSGLVCQVIFVFLALALYRLFKEVSEPHAKTMVALVVAAVPVAFLNTLNQLAALQVLTGADYLNAFGTDGRLALATFLLELHGQGLVVVGLFWGLWLLPLGLLVIRSRFMPRGIGVLLIAACIGYVLDVVVRLLSPGMAAIVAPVAAASKFGELVIIAWLLFGRVDAPLTTALRPGFMRLD